MGKVILLYLERTVYKLWTVECCFWNGKKVNREFKITTTETATGTSLNKLRFNEQNNGSPRAL